MNESGNGIFRHKFKVPDNAVDENGHANNVWYVKWMQDVAMHHSEDRGSLLATKLHGASWFVRSHHIDYYRPAFGGDDLTVLTWVSEFHSVRCIRKYKFLRDDSLIARGETDWVFVDAASGRPIRIPVEISRRFHIISKQQEP